VDLLEYTCSGDFALIEVILRLDETDVVNKAVAKILT